MKRVRRRAPALPAEVRRAMVTHARREAPRECCGLLIGQKDRVQFALALPNVASRALTRFRIDDRQHIEIRRWLRRVQPPLEIVGVYHSHPEGDAQPSASDREEWHYPDWLYVVVGLGGNRPVISIRRLRLSPDPAGNRGV